MKARKIDLRNYKITINTRSPLLEKILTTPGVGLCLRDSERWERGELDSLLRQGPVMQDYDAKESIINLLFNLKVPAKEAWEKRDPLADKIRVHDGEVLLDTDEYAMLLRAFEQFDRPGKNEQELLKRVFGAEEIELEEKKSG